MMKVCTILIAAMSASLFTSASALKRKSMAKSSLDMKEKREGQGQVQRQGFDGQMTCLDGKICKLFGDPAKKDSKDRKTCCHNYGGNEGKTFCFTSNQCQGSFGSIPGKVCRPETYVADGSTNLPAWAIELADCGESLNEEIAAKQEAEKAQKEAEKKEPDVSNYVENWASYTTNGDDRVFPMNDHKCYTKDEFDGLFTGFRWQLVSDDKEAFNRKLDVLKQGLSNGEECPKKSNGKYKANQEGFN